MNTNDVLTKLIAEIERRKADAKLYDMSGGDAPIYDELLSLITSLQQEQPVLPGIEEPGIPGKDYIPVEWVDACEMYGKWKIVKREQPEVDLDAEIAIYLNRNLLNRINHNDIIEDFTTMEAGELARYFYELRRKSK